MTAYKFTDEVREEFLSLLRAGFSRKTALEKVDITRYTLRNHMIDDPLFAADVAAAEEEGEVNAVEAVEDAVLQKALRGHAASQQFYLCNKRPKKWSVAAKAGAEGSGMALEEMEKYVEGLIEYCLGFIAESRRGEFLDGIAGVGNLPSGSRKGLPKAPSPDGS